MKKIMITGASGMLGATLADEWKSKYDVFPVIGSNFLENTYTNYINFDFSQDDYSALIAAFKPDTVVHCAALTNLEFCEQNPDLALKVNGESVNKLIQSFPKAKIIYISSDAVYPLNTHLATEDIPTNPTSVYGKSKQLGESYVESSIGNCAIRTTIVGKNINKKKTSFAEWIVKSLQIGTEITLFDDVIFTPITIWHLKTALEWVIEHETPPFLNIVGKQAVTKYEFAVSLAHALGFSQTGIKKGKLSENPKLQAKRAHDMTLDSSLFESMASYKLPSLDDGILELKAHFIE